MDTDDLTQVKRKGSEAIGRSMFGTRCRCTNCQKVKATQHETSRGVVVEFEVASSARHPARANRKSASVFTQADSKHDWVGSIILEN